jgi:hypothetical protein
MVDLDGIVVSNGSQRPHCGLQWVTTTALWSPAPARGARGQAPRLHIFACVARKCVGNGFNPSRQQGLFEIVQVGVVLYFMGVDVLFELVP